ncbi:DUF5994 family protein [Streptomyces sp. NPDC006530]|uniref:DUF5994 family protein n=1 Tax=Streptomyces sp. NPDC006530 TaxID=3364750 RepID=UPI0036A3C2D7
MTARTDGGAATPVSAGAGGSARTAGVTSDAVPPRRAQQTPTPRAARFALKSPGNSPGLPDCACWPRSRDLLRELPALVDLLDARWARITRIAVNPEHWSVIPRKIRTTGHVVKAGWFKDEQDPHILLVLAYTAGRGGLLVIPPEPNALAAARLMAAATVITGPQLTASALMAAEAALRDATAPGRLQDREEAWDEDGPPRPTPPSRPGPTPPSGRPPLIGM